MTSLSPFRRAKTPATTGLVRVRVRVRIRVRVRVRVRASVELEAEVPAYFIP